METVLTVLLVRFALLLAVLLVIALVAFTVLVVLRRRGRIDSARAGVGRVARFGAEHLGGQGARSVVARRALGHVAERTDR